MTPSQLSASGRGIDSLKACLVFGAMSNQGEAADVLGTPLWYTFDWEVSSKTIGYWAESVHLGVRLEPLLSLLSQWAIAATGQGAARWPESGPSCSAYSKLHQFSQRRIQNPYKCGSYT